MLAGRELPRAGRRGSGSWAAFSRPWPSPRRPPLRAFSIRPWPGQFFSIFFQRSSSGCTSVGGEQVAADPGLAGRAAPGIVDQADRHVERLVELPAEEVADGGESLDGLGRADFPLALKIVLRLLRADLRDRDQADLGIVRRRALEVAVIGCATANCMFDWPEQSQTSPTSTSSKRDRVLAPDRQRVRAAGRHRVERDQPLAIAARPWWSWPAVDRDGDVLSRSAPPQTRSFWSRCSTMWLPKNDGSFTSPARGGRPRPGKSRPAASRRGRQVSGTDNGSRVGPPDIPRWCCPARRLDSVADGPGGCHRHVRP